MKIVSIDPSINGSGITICDVDEKYNIINDTLNSYYLTETKSKVDFTYNNSINGVLNIKTNKFDNLYYKIEYVVDNIIKILPNPEECFIVLESNALSGGGRIVDISEFTGALKYQLIKYGYSFEQFEPTAIKTVLGKGNKSDDKTTMDLKLEIQYPNLYNYIFRNITDDKIFKIGESPKADIVDSLLIILYYLKLIKKQKGII